MRRTLFLTAVCGVSAWMLFAIGQAAGDEKESKELKAFFDRQAAEAARAFDKVPKEQVEAWKKKYAYESLRDRLAYEKSTVRPAPRVGEEAAKELKQADDGVEAQEHSNRRAISLMMLHGENVDKFVKTLGFGFSRMQPPGPSYLHEREVERIPLASVAPLSDGDASLSITAPLAADAKAAGAPSNRWMMPPAREVVGYHRNMARVFTWADRNGFVKSVDQVAGFRPHAILWAQPTPIDYAAVRAAGNDHVAAADPGKRWKVTRMELVSLLKQETPRVYLSENLPRMDDLSSVKTRAVNTFESAGLEKLVAGGDMHTASTPNRIEMLGSLRASKQCLECHQVPHGTLLGAFSYELRRDPPIVVEKEKLAPIQ